MIWRLVSNNIPLKIITSSVCSIICNKKTMGFHVRATFLEGDPKRYHNLISWAWLDFLFSLLWDTSSN